MSCTVYIHYFIKEKNPRNEIFFYNPIKYYNTYLRSTLLTRITLQYYWDEYPRGARGYDYPKGINIDKRKEKKNYLN